MTRKTLTSAHGNHTNLLLNPYTCHEVLLAVDLLTLRSCLYKKPITISHHPSSFYWSSCRVMSGTGSVITVIWFSDMTYCSILTLSVDLMMSGSPNKQAVHAKQLSILMSLLVSKPLQSKYITLLESDNVDKPDSAKQLQQHLHSESESAAFAIQDQVIIATRVYKAKIISKHLPSPMCRVCGQVEETIIPLLSSWLFLYCYNLLASVLHWHLSKSTHSHLELLFDLLINLHPWLRTQLLHTSLWILVWCHNFIN